MRKKILINRKALNRGEAYVLLRRSKMRMSRKRRRLLLKEGERDGGKEQQNG